MLNREVKKNPALMAMLNTEKEDKAEKVEKVASASSSKKQKRSARERNPQGYERYRGRSNGNPCKPMSYYIPDDLLKYLAIFSAKTGKSKSELVCEGLRYVLREEIKADKQKKTSSTPNNENIEKEAI